MPCLCADCTTTTSGGDGTFSPPFLLLLFPLLFWSCCWLPCGADRQPSCSPIGRHPIRWEGWGSSRATGEPDRSRLPLAAATATKNALFHFKGKRVGPSTYHSVRCSGGSSTRHHHHRRRRRARAHNQSLLLDAPPLLPPTCDPTLSPRLAPTTSLLTIECNWRDLTSLSHDKRKGKGHASRHLHRDKKETDNETSWWCDETFRLDVANTDNFNSRVSSLYILNTATYEYKREEGGWLKRGSSHGKHVSALYERARVVHAYRMSGRTLFDSLPISVTVHQIGKSERVVKIGSEISLISSQKRSIRFTLTLKFGLFLFSFFFFFFLFLPPLPRAQPFVSFVPISSGNKEDPSDCEPSRFP